MHGRMWTQEHTVGCGHGTTQWAVDTGVHGRLWTRECTVDMDTGAHGRCGHGSVNEVWIHVVINIFLLSSKAVHCRIKFFIIN